jgi:hypothetical protein
MSIYCPSCGKSIPSDSKICAYCGKSIPSHGVIEVPKEENNNSKTVLIIALVVILLLVVPIAIAATVYVYTSSMIGTAPTSTPSIQFVKDDVNNKFTIASVDPYDVEWADLKISLSNSDSQIILTRSNVWYDNSTNYPGAPFEWGAINEGDILQFDNGSFTVTITHINTNTLVGIWDFN